MINKKKKGCQNILCNVKKPSFNFNGEKKGIFCSIHKKPDMINVTYKRCKFQDCTITDPLFNFEGEKKGIFCSIHKKPNMINVRSKRCEFQGCNSIFPLFNFKGESEGIFCFIHKDPDMIDIRHKKCEFIDCIQRPTFNFQGNKKAKFCNEHKDPNMIDVVNKKCIICKKTRAGFGYTCSSKTHCSKCKEKFMIKNTYTFCSFDNCQEYCTYGIKKPERCEIHKNQKDICWLVKPCTNCKNDNEILNKYNLCTLCADIPFYEENKKREKIKENSMIKYLRQNIVKKETLTDSVIDSSCNNYRPDLLYDCDTFIVVIECDENQHKNYHWESCALNRSLKHAEEKRMYAISQAYGLPAIFLRWNPDIFRVNNRIAKNYSLSKRLEILKKWVEYCFKMNHIQGILYKNLFYDEYNELNTDFIMIDEKEMY